MFLDELFKDTPHIEINQLSIDSRLPMKDCIFFCIAGIKDDGHDYIKEAVKNGAKVIVYQNDIDTNLNAIFIKVKDTIDCLNKIAPKFYDYPSNKLETYVSSGSDDVDVISYILYNLLNNFKPTASIGVNGIRYKENHLLSNVPTLNIIDTQKYLNSFVLNDIKCCLLEADSLALSYKKLDGVRPDVFIYTNTNEYSAYYQEMDVNYYDVMCSYLYTLDNDTAIILNRDDPSFDELSKASGDNTFTYGIDSNCDYVIGDVLLLSDKSEFTLKHEDVEYSFSSKLLGLRNIYNLAACLAALNIKGYDLKELALVLPFIKPMKGRIEPIIEDKYHAYIDSANDFVSIENIFNYAKNILPYGKKIVTLLGINSSDEKESIKELAFLCSKYVNRVVLTQNNTYSGNTLNILNNAEKYFDKNKPLVVEERRFAIEAAVNLLNSDDILLVLGKGNEQFITGNLGKESYDGDYKITKECIEKRIKEDMDNF